MTDLRTAAQQALEALSEVDNCTYINDYGDAALDTAYESGMVYKAIAALRAALAQQASPAAAWKHAAVLEAFVGSDANGRAALDALYKLAAPRAAMRAVEENK